MSIFRKLFGKKEQQPLTVKERTIQTIQVGDIVTYDLEDYQVVSTLTYNDHGFEWTAYQLDGPQTLWLSVEMDDELYVGMYKKTTLKLNDPFPKKLEHEGIKYELDESGTAQVRGVGRGKNVNNMNCRYIDYCDEEEEHFLSVEVWGSEVEVSYGYAIKDYEIKVIAGQ